MPVPKFTKRTSDYDEILVTELSPSRYEECEIGDKTKNEEIKNAKEFLQVLTSLGYDLMNSTPQQVSEFLSEARKTLKK